MPDPFYLWKDQPFYFGKGKGSRVYSHRKEAKRLWENPDSNNSNSIRNYIIHKLWNLNSDFKEEILFENLTEQKALELEIAMIAKYGRIDMGTGCLSNMTDGGENGNYSEEWKLGISKTQKERYSLMTEEERKIRFGHNRGKQVHTEEYKLWLHINRSGKNHPSYGKNHTQETKDKISKIKTGKKLGPQSEEHKRNRADAIRGEKHPMYGKHHTEETKYKISKSISGENHPMYGRTHTEESRKKIKENHADFSGENHPQYGKPRSEETRKKISEKAKGRPSKWKGCKHKEESKKILSAKAKERYNGDPKKHPMYGRKKTQESINKGIETRKRNKALKNYLSLGYMMKCHPKYLIGING